jgi:hypothetical protein
VFPQWKRKPLIDSVPTLNAEGIDLLEVS